MRIFLILLAQFITLLAGAQDTIVVQDLRHAWVSMNKDGELTTYLPGTSTKVVFFQLPEELKAGQVLKVAGLRPLDVWLNDQLIFHQLDSSVYLNNLSAGDYFKIYSKRDVSEAAITQVLEIKGVRETAVTAVSERTILWGDEYYLVVLTLIILLAGVYRRFFPITFNQSMQNPLSYKIRSISVDQTYVNFGSIDNLFSIFYFSVLVVFFLSFLGYDLILISSKTFIYSLLNWLMLSLLVSLMVLAKFLWTKTIAGLFQIRELPNIQTQDFVHFFTLIATGGVLVSLTDFMLYDSSADFLKAFVWYMSIGSLLFFQFWLFFKFDKFSSLKKLVIISYLCTTEFLPGFLAIYWLVKM